MSNPNFSESQLQQAVNSALIQKIHEVTGEFPFANVPSLFDEYELGWDSAFYFSWLPHLPLSDHEGCNYFIQYKLSQLLTSRGAKEWKTWEDEYYRFKIPHSKRNYSTKKFEDDYHQWEALKKLSENNYPTFYVTNSTLEKDALIKASKSGTLLDITPALDVRNIINQHKYVTFTNISSNFFMHSEIENVKKSSISQIFEYDRQNLSLRDANRKLLSELKNMGGNNELFLYELNKITEKSSQNTDMPSHLMPYFKHSMISNFVHKYIGAKLMWVPVKG